MTTQEIASIPDLTDREKQIRAYGLEILDDVHNSAKRYNSDVRKFAEAYKTFRRAQVGGTATESMQRELDEMAGRL